MSAPNNFGILRGRIDEPYANIGSALTGDSCSMVGLYYSLGTQIVICLFRTFDGSSINYFGDGVNFERLSSHHLITNITIYPFDVESWKIEGNMDDLYSRFRSCVARSMTNSSEKNYQKLLLQTAGLSDEPIHNGYRRVNEILLATCGIDPNRRKGCLHRSIVDCRFLMSGQDITQKYRNQYSEPTTDEISSETRRYLTSLGESFIELVATNQLYRLYLSKTGQMPATNNKDILEHFISIMNNEDTDSMLKQRLLEALTPYTQEKVIEVETKPLNIEAELAVFRNLIEDLKTGFSSEEYIPTISAETLVDAFNKIADKVEIPRVEPTIKGSYKYKSVGAIILSGKDGFHTDETTVELKCGEVIVIPTKGADLSDFSEDELLEINRYLLSIKTFDCRFESLSNLIIETLANRSRV